MKIETNNLKIHFSSGPHVFNIDFRCKNGECSYSAESEIALRLLPAMLNFEDIQLENKVIDPLFLNSLIDIQHIYHSWKPDYQIIKINNNAQKLIPDQKATQCNKKRVATFFSGGVDSFFTLLKHQSEITDIIFVHGLDIPLENVKLRQQTITALKDIAKEFKVNLLEVETTLRTELALYGEWGTILHGVALVSVGLLLQKEFSIIFIPASHDYANLFPWGTHPILDHLWSTNMLHFIHDGAEATRLQKVELISKSETALQHLRVCWKNSDGAYNCGKCEKCLRTMINLYVCGKLSNCSTFSEPLSNKRVAKMKLKGKNTRNFARENIKKLEHMKDAKALEKALKHALRTSMFKKLIKKSYK